MNASKKGTSKLAIISFACGICSVVPYAFWNSHELEWYCSGLMLWSLFFTSLAIILSIITLIIEFLRDLDSLEFFLASVGLVLGGGGLFCFLSIALACS